MCYSFDATVSSFMISLLASYYLIKRNKGNDVYISIIIFGVSLMQVAEAILHLDVRCDTTLNLLGSKLAWIVLLFLQPFFSILSTIYQKGNIFTKEVVIHILIWILLLCYVILRKWPQKWCTTKNEECGEPHCKLNWNQWYHTDIIYNILYSMVVFGIPIMIMKKQSFYWVIYLILSVLLIWNSKFFATHWCFLVPTSSLLLQYNLQ